MRYLQLVLAKVSFVTKQPDDMREVSWFDSSWKTYLWTKICLVGLLFKAGFHSMEKSPLIFSVTKMKMYWSAWSLPCSVGCLLVLLVSCGSLCGQHLGFAHFVHMWFNLWSTTVFSALLTLYSSGLLCGQPPSPVLSTLARGATTWTWFLQYIWADPCKLSDCSWVDFGKVVEKVFANEPPGHVCFKIIFGSTRIIQTICAAISLSACGKGMLSSGLNYPAIS